MKIKAKHAQRGDGEISFLIVLIIFGVFVYLIWRLIHFSWQVVSTAPTTDEIVAQQALAKSLDIPFDQYIANTCALENVCHHYNNARMQCASAGSIKECIKIKMDNADYSACEGGDFSKHVPGTTDLLPTYNQCFFNKVGKIFGRTGNDTDEKQASDNMPPPGPKVLPPNSGSSTPSGDDWYWWKCKELKIPTLANTAPYPDCYKTTAPLNKPNDISSTPSPKQASGPWTKYALPAASFGAQPKAPFDPSTARLLQPNSGEITSLSQLPPPPGWKGSAPSVVSKLSAPAPATPGEITSLSQLPPPPGWKPPATDAGRTSPPPHQSLALGGYARSLAFYSALRRHAEKGDAKAFASLSQAANDGDSTAQFELGRLYDDRKNLLRANYWYRKSANQGDGNAQNALGYAYERGLGVSKNEVMADQWYLKSANQGDAFSQIALGINYLMGLGVSVDPVESYKWFYLALLNPYSSTDALSIAATQLQVAELTPAQIALAKNKASQWLKAHHTR